MGDDAGVSGASSDDGLEPLIGTLLAALAEIGRFESAYVTAVDWDARQQEVRYVHNTGGYEVPRGMRIECPPDLSERVFLGVTRSNELPTAQPDSLIAKNLGLATYASVPIITADHRLYGTLCGVSRERRDVSDAAVNAMQYFARLITDQMARDEAEEDRQRAVVAEGQLRDRALFLAEAEHMLKTPLSVLLGWAETMRRLGRDIPEAERVAAVDAIGRSSQVLATQINRLLEESKAEVRARDLHLVAVELVDNLEATVEALRAACPRHEVRSQGTPPLWALVDPELLFQILAHLLDNAAKYSPPATSITLTTRHAGRWAEIDVTDEGVGIPVDVDVFAAFQRGHDPSVTTAPGVGLGLHIVRDLTRAMGGEARARRNAGRGSTFTLRLPVARPTGSCHYPSP